jgi:ABC-type antimicrobial peptide transport system ATPase subunit
LVAVNRQVMDAVEIPFVLLIDIDADQMGHHVGKTMVVIPFYPDHRDPTFRIRQLANVAEKLPVFFFKAAEIQIAENIAQQDQAVKRNRFQHLQSSLGTAYLRTQMQVR